MARAYIVLARNDLDANFLQVLDLWPNSSLRNQSISAPGQTHGLTHYFLDGVNSAIVTDGAFLVNGDNYGLSAYLIGKIQNVNAGEALTSAQSIAIAVRVEGRVAAGLGLTAAEINIIIADEVGTASGIGLGTSVATVEEMLRILAGERFYQQDNQILEAGGTWTPDTGVFVGRALVELPESVRTGTAGDDLRPRLPVRGRNPFVGKAIPTSTAAQDNVLAAVGGSQTAGTISDINFTDALAVSDSGRLQQSAISGALSKLAISSYSWRNFGNAYTAAAVTADRPRAATIAGVNISAPGTATQFEGRAVTVYAADGNVIV